MCKLQNFKLTSRRKTGGINKERVSSKSCFAFPYPDPQLYHTKESFEGSIMSVKMSKEVSFGAAAKRGKGGAGFSFLRNRSIFQKSQIYMGDSVYKKLSNDEKCKP